MPDKWSSFWKPDRLPIYVVRKVWKLPSKRGIWKNILNTSFNGQDEPIVEKPAEALSAFLKMPLNALVVPPYIIYKQNQAAKSAYHN